MNNTLNIYEQEEDKEEEITVRIEWFVIITNKPDEFIDRLEKLCLEYCPAEDFYFMFTFEG